MKLKLYKIITYELFSMRNITKLRYMSTGCSYKATKIVKKHRRVDTNPGVGSYPR